MDDAVVVNPASLADPSSSLQSRRRLVWTDRPLLLDIAGETLDVRAVGGRRGSEYDVNCDDSPAEIVVLLKIWDDARGTKSLGLTDEELN